MAYRQRDISSTDDEVRGRQALQSIATEARVANANMPALEFSGGDPGRMRQGMQALSTAARDALIQNSADQGDEPTDVVDESDAAGRLRVFAKNFEKDFL